MQQVPADNLILTQQCTVFVRQRPLFARNCRSESERRMQDQFFVEEFFDSRLEVPRRFCLMPFSCYLGDTSLR